MERHQFPNDPCTSCHSQDMSTITLKDGSILPLEESVPLCAQCHRDIHNAWKEGKHGMSDRECIECHDPHFENSKSPLLTLKALTYTSILQLISSIGAVIGITLAILAVTKVR